MLELALDLVDWSLLIRCRDVRIVTVGEQRY